MVPWVSQNRISLLSQNRVSLLSQIGNTALMYAAHGNHPHCVNELLMHGADISITNENGDSAYAIVIHRGSQLGKSFQRQTPNKSVFLLIKTKSFVCICSSNGYRESSFNPAGLIQVKASTLFYSNIYGGKLFNKSDEHRIEVF